MGALFLALLTSFRGAKKEVQMTVEKVERKT